MMRRAGRDDGFVGAEAARRSVVRSISVPAFRLFSRNIPLQLGPALRFQTIKRLIKRILIENRNLPGIPLFDQQSRGGVPRAIPKTLRRTTCQLTLDRAIPGYVHYY